MKVCVAQLVEQVPLEYWVAGSIPVTDSLKKGIYYVY